MRRASPAASSAIATCGAGFVLDPLRVWIGGTEVIVTAHAITPTRTDFDTEVDARRDDGDADYTGWFCVVTDAWPCPADGCDFVAHHMTAAHLIVVWPSGDDSALLGQAASARRLRRNPRVSEYRTDMGPCIPWDVWQRLRRPIHARIDRPDGWDEDAWKL